MLQQLSGTPTVVLWLCLALASAVVGVLFGSYGRHAVFWSLASVAAFSGLAPVSKNPAILTGLCVVSLVTLPTYSMTLFEYKRGLNILENVQLPVKTPIRIWSDFISPPAVVHLNESESLDFESTSGAVDTVTAETTDAPRTTEDAMTESSYTTSIKFSSTSEMKVSTGAASGRSTELISSESVTASTNVVGVEPTAHGFSEQLHRVVNSAPDIKQIFEASGSDVLPSFMKLMKGLPRQHVARRIGDIAALAKKEENAASSRANARWSLSDLIGLMAVFLGSSPAEYSDLIKFAEQDHLFQSFTASEFEALRKLLADILLDLKEDATQRRMQAVLSWLKHSPIRLIAKGKDEDLGNLMSKLSITEAAVALQKEARTLVRLCIVAIVVNVLLVIFGITGWSLGRQKPEPSQANPEPSTSASNLLHSTAREQPPPESLSFVSAADREAPSLRVLVADTAANNNAVFPRVAASRNFRQSLPSGSDLPSSPAALTDPESAERDDLLPSGAKPQDSISHNADTFKSIPPEAEGCKGISQEADLHDVPQEVSKSEAGNDCGSPESLDHGDDNSALSQTVVSDGNIKLKPEPEIDCEATEHPEHGTREEEFSQRDARNQKLYPTVKPTQSMGVMLTQALRCLHMNTPTSYAPPPRLAEPRGLRHDVEIPPIGERNQPTDDAGDPPQDSRQSRPRRTTQNETEILSFEFNLTRSSDIESADGGHETICS